MEAQAVDKSTEIKSSKKIEIYENKPNIAHSQKAAAVGVETKSKVKAAATDTTTVATIKDEEEKVGVDECGCKFNTGNSSDSKETYFSSSC
ncbi:uncharacterized protein LOC131043485 isoform X3 [Cryptomeria japonica]|uniref:uncharacterized protein LOC131043485 isoform X3 n=1 Tax=Cryptomeria japonica TaxID=3369 RepID=UPI0025AD73B5|nr:uncharacterized protein LOC131043485 isoform X3 [Cryptomeria japonica]